MQKLDSECQLKMNFALTCDLDLEFCLIPKEWVIEAINLAVLKYVSQCVEYTVEMIDEKTLHLYYEVTN